MADAVPHTMKAVRLAAYHKRPQLDLRDVPTPFPGASQVLVKVRMAPIHLDDVVFCRGQHAFRRALPATPGFEGMGTVVAVGGGLITRWLMGRRVAFAAPEDADGSFAEYAVVDASRCVPVWDGLPDEQAAMLLVDPVTTLALLDAVREQHHKGIVQTAPTGTVGRMVGRMGKRLGIPIIHVAEDEAEARAVSAEGAETVLDASSSDFDGQLRRATRTFQATALLDGVGSDLTGRLLAAMPDGSSAIVYGLAPGNRVQVDLSELVYRRKQVSGFCFLDRARAQGTRGLLAQLPRLRRRTDELRTTVGRRIGLHEVPHAIAHFVEARVAGRVLICHEDLPVPPSVG